MTPYFRKIYKFPVILVKFTASLLHLHFLLPYFDHDALMHHALHVLSVSGYNTQMVRDKCRSSGHQILLWFLLAIVVSTGSNLRVKVVGRAMKNHISLQTLFTFNTICIKTRLLIFLIF